MINQRAHGSGSEEAGRAFIQRQKEILRLVCQPDVFGKAALETVNWTAANFSCARVGLGMVRKGSVQLQALSHSAWFDRKSQAVTAIENAMEEALDQRHSSASLNLPPFRKPGQVATA